MSEQYNKEKEQQPVKRPLLDLYIQKTIMRQNELMNQQLKERSVISIIRGEVPKQNNLH